MLATVTILHRHAESAVSEALADTRVVVVIGARQAGKSTLVKLVTKGILNTEIRQLDRPTELAAARKDPESFVRHDGLLVIDEIQRSPELILPIKSIVDAEPNPGRFLLTGSARLLGLRNLPDSLIGRSETIELWPFSQGELGGVREDFLDRAFADNPMRTTSTTLLRANYLNRAVVGGYPEATKRTDGRRRKFFDAYIDDLIDRDITQLSEIQRRPDLIRLLALLAQRMATPVSIRNLAEELVVPKSTVERYVALLEEVYVIKHLSGWATSATKRATQREKLFFVDSGLAAHLAGLTETNLSRHEASIGQLLENFVIGEVCRQLSWSSAGARAYHYRDRDGREVDLILEARDGRIVGIEVKAGATVRAEDVRHLAHLRDALGDRFHRGIVLHTGDTTRSFGDRIVATPLAALWE